MEGKIVVLAGNMEQFKYWLRHNIIPVTKNDDIHRVIGCKIDAVYKEGTWYKNLSTKTLEEIKMRKNL
jgi:hypothetical protein